MRVLVVDDMDSMRTLVVHYLSRIDTVSVVGEADNGKSALDLVVDRHPDIVLLDISLPGISGVEVARRIKSAVPNIRIYLFSAFDVGEYRDLGLDSPADGYIQKTHLKKELQEMIQAEIARVASRPSGD